MTNAWIKDPNAELDYTVDWSAWLETGDEIATAEAVADTGITLESDSNTTTAVTAWVSGGTAGETYQVRFRVTTTGGRTDDRTITLIIGYR